LNLKLARVCRWFRCKKYLILAPKDRYTLSTGNEVSARPLRSTVLLTFAARTAERYVTISFGPRSQISRYDEVSVLVLWY